MGTQVLGRRLQVVLSALGQRRRDVHLTQKPASIQQGHALSVLANAETGVTCSKFAVANHRGSSGGVGVGNCIKLTSSTTVLFGCCRHELKQPFGAGRLVVCQLIEVATCTTSSFDRSFRAIGSCP